MEGECISAESNAVQVYTEKPFVSSWSAALEMRRNAGEHALECAELSWLLDCGQEKAASRLRVAPTLPRVL